MAEPTDERTAPTPPPPDQDVDAMARRMIAESVTATGAPRHRNGRAEAPEAIAAEVPDGEIPTGSTPSDLMSVPEPSPDGHHDLTQPQYFLNRELTWLNFNFRVLHEAEDPRTPLLERMKFLSIVSSNLDEFFMKRIGGLKQQVGAGVTERTVDGRTPEQQIRECRALILELEGRKRRVFLDLLEEYGEHDIVVRDYASLDDQQQVGLRERFLTTIYPLLTPQATDPAHPFPFISNLSLNLLVTLSYPDESGEALARVKVPVGPDVPRFLALPDGHRFVRLEDVMRANLDLLFPGMRVDDCEFFRVTRNASTDLDEEAADDLLARIETGLRQRRLASVVRMEVSSQMSETHRGMLAAELGLNEDTDVFAVEGMLGMRDVMELASMDLPALHDVPHHPVDHPKLIGEGSIFHFVRESRDTLLFHPYESYSTSVERLLREASQDPKVRAIKMTLYRTAEDSQTLRYLIDAARNGKQVAVVLELQARFDEAANIRWANRLGSFGIHVTYGVVGLKTHCKAILVVRQDYYGIKRYVHIGTGNYNSDTARLYSDVGLLTCDDQIGEDLTELFNYLTTGYKPNRGYKKLLPSPKMFKRGLLDRITREIELHRPDDPGLIQIKANALEDPEVIRALYRAAAAGVRIDLIVRDTCRLRPGIPGLSESIRVISVVGRFLEHARVYYFRNGGEEEYFIGSADVMSRNLMNRVEIVVPVEAPDLRTELRFLLDTQLGDHRSAWEMGSDGSYVQRKSAKGKKAKGTHQVMIEWAERRHKDATRLKRRKTRGVPLPTDD